MLTYRDLIQKYAEYIPKVRNELLEACHQRNPDQKPDDRDIINIYTMLIPVRILMENTNIKFPFSYEDFQSLMIDKLQEHMEIQATSNDVEQYLIVLSSVVNMVGGIREGEHFKIQKETDGLLKLFIRTRQVHPGSSVGNRDQEIP